MMSPMHHPRSSRVRIMDVAVAAGVSIGTVSNTLNHPERVTAETRERVMAAVQELGFVPNQQARVLTGAPSRTIGLMVVDLISPFFMEVAHAVEQAASEAGYVVILCNSENLAERQDQRLKLLAAQRVVGALLTPAGGGLPETEATIGLPLVLIDYEGDEHPCSVVVDHIEGGRQAAKHLIDLGHTSLAFVGGLPELRQFEQRVIGMKRAMEEAGLDPATLIELRSDGIGVESGEVSATQLLKGSTLPTGICCGNDMLAFGVYRRLTRSGVRVPDDMALVGYDDIDFAANWIVPLTSVRQPTREMGRLAAELLLEHAGDGEHEHRRIVLKPELVVRRSSGALD